MINFTIFTAYLALKLQNAVGEDGETFRQLNYSFI